MADILPAVYAVSREHRAGCFTYMTPHWPDASAYLRGLLGAEADRAPVSPPERAWVAQVGECRYRLASVALGGGAG